MCELTRWNYLRDSGSNVADKPLIRELGTTHFEVVHNELTRKWHGRIVNDQNGEIQWSTEELNSKAACLIAIEAARLTNTYTVTKIVTDKTGPKK